MFLPSLLSWLCKLAVIGIFLAAFAIPVTFESVMWVTGSGSLANTVSFTPGAVGITQATNALALDTCCAVPGDTAVAYSTAQQLVTTAWNVLFALVLVVFVFGWSGGKLLVGQSYTDAKGEGRRAEGAARREEGGEEARARMSGYGETVRWQPERPRFRPLRLLISWVLTAVSLWATARLLPGVDVVDTGGALAMAAVVAAINAIIPPLLAALRLPFMLALGFILVLIANAVALRIGSDILDSFEVDNFGGRCSPRSSSRRSASCSR